MLYVAQGIPFGLVLMALPPYLAANGVDPLAIGGFLSAALLPHGIKLINAPLMDRWTYWPMGKRRPWVLIAQLALILALIALSFIPDPSRNLSLLTIGCFVVMFCGAFQDVATDGMAVDLLPIEDQPKASSIMFGGVTLSGAGAAVATGWLLSEFGLAATAILSAFAVSLIALIPLVARERPGERLLPWTAGKANQSRGLPPKNFREIALNVKRYFLLPASLLLALAIFIYGISRGIHLSLMPVYFVQELGWSDTEFSSISGVALMAGGGFAILFGGALLDTLGRRQTFVLGGGLLAVLAILVAALPTLGESEFIMSAYRVAYNTLDTLIVVASIAIGMAISTRVIAATQFAIYMAMSNVGYSLGSALFGQLQLALSYSQVFIVFAVVAVIGTVVMRAVAIETHAKRSLELEAEVA